MFWILLNLPKFRTPLFTDVYIYVCIMIISVNFHVSLDALLFWLMMSFIGHHLFVVLMKHKLVCGQCSLIDVVCFQVRILKLMKTLKKQGHWFGIILVLMPLDGVQSNRGGAKNITCTFCDTSFTTCFQLERLLIFLEEMFSDKRDRMLDLRRAQVCAPVRPCQPWLSSP